MNFSEYFYYDETSPSCLRWRVSVKGASKEGKVAGGLDSKGYYVVRLIGAQLKCHRVIYELCYGQGSLEGLYIDHIDGDRANNRLSNLRSASASMNSQNKVMGKNNSTGISGVCLSTDKCGRVSAIATWRDYEGKPRSKSFSVTKYGKEEAIYMATLAREKALKLLNSAGQSYSERHGRLNLKMEEVCNVGSL